MSELRTIETKHKREDAETLRIAAAELDLPGISLEAKQLLMYAISAAWRIDEAFARSKVVTLRPSQRTEPPKPAA